VNAVEGEQESAWRRHLLDPVLASTLLWPTGNLLAAEVHQATPASSDLSFDFSLISVWNAARGIEGLANPRPMEP